MDILVFLKVILYYHDGTILVQFAPLNFDRPISKLLTIYFNQQAQLIPKLSRRVYRR